MAPGRKAAMPAGNMPACPWHKLADGISVRVRVTPRASRDGVDGIGEAVIGGRSVPVLLLRVHAAPSEGAANEAVRRLVAALSDRPLRDVTLASGQTGRVKTLIIAGDPAALEAQLSARSGLSAAPPPARPGRPPETEKAGSPSAASGRTRQA